MARKAKAKASPAQSQSKVNPKRKADWDTLVDDKAFDGFAVRTVKPATLHRSLPANKKRRTAKGSVDASEDSTLLQKNPIKDSNLSSVFYQIEPASAWDSLNKYRRFTIESEQIEINQFVFINYAPDTGASATEVNYWVAKVLEVRGADSAHVFIRVAWMYRPEDLPAGRQPHHGKFELIASNHIDVVDAQSVQHIADVIHWADEVNDDECPYQDQLFWRQSLDVALPKSRQCSKLKNHCIDKSPRNPDEDLIYCPLCKTWLHARCLQDQAMKDAGSSNGSTKQSFSAMIRTLRTGETTLTVTDLRKSKNNRKWNVDIVCLKCNDIIEQAKEYSGEVEADDNDEDELADVLGDNVTVTPVSPTPDASDDDDSAVDLEHPEHPEVQSTPSPIHQDPVTTEPVIESAINTLVGNDSALHPANDSVMNLIKFSEPVKSTPSRGKRPFSQFS